MATRKPDRFFVSKLCKPDILSEMRACGIETVYINETSRIAGELRYHPDILLCQCPDGEWITSADVAQANREKFESFGMKVEISAKELGGKYPEDVRFNAFFVNGTLFCSRFTAPELREKSEGCILFRQGYVKCSVAVVDSESYITADKGIYAQLAALKKNVLLIEPYNIGLSGYSYGFIGGASGMIKPDTLAFFGDIRTHGSYENIKAFLDNIGINMLSLCEGELYDYGGMIRI